MCAIYGVIGKVDQKLIKQISEVQIYRGPDQQNIIESNDKLSILATIDFQLSIKKRCATYEVR